MALMDGTQYAGEWPQIGIVRSEEENTVEVHWYGGRKSSTWKPCKKAVPGGRGRKEDWVEKLPSTCITTTFKLTISGNILKHVKEIIDTYHDRDIFVVFYYICGRSNFNSCIITF